MSKLAPINGTPRWTIVIAILLATALAGCAGRAPHAGNDPRDGSTGNPRGIDYQGFPYNLQAG